MNGNSGMFESVGAVGMILYLAVIVLIVASIWKVFAKAGRPGWAAIIPIYNYIVMAEIAGKPAWWVILMLFLPFIFVIWVYNLIAKSFGKGVGFTLGLLFLPFIFWPILGFGDATYKGPAGK